MAGVPTGKRNSFVSIQTWHLLIKRRKMPFNSILNFQGLANKARSKSRSIHAPNLTNELNTAEERRLNQFGSAD